MNGFFTKCRQYVLSVNNGTKKHSNNKTFTFKQIIVTDEKDCPVHKIQKKCKKTIYTGNVSSKTFKVKTGPINTESTHKDPTKSYNMSLSKSIKGFKNEKYKKSTSKQNLPACSFKVNENPSNKPGSNFKNKANIIPCLKTVNLKNHCRIIKHNELLLKHEKFKNNAKNLHVYNIVSNAPVTSSISSAIFFPKDLNIQPQFIEPKKETTFISEKQNTTESIQNIGTETHDVKATNTVPLNKIYTLSFTQTDDRKSELITNKTKNKIKNIVVDQSTKYLVFDSNISVVSARFVSNKENITNTNDDIEANNESLNTMNDKNDITSNKIVSNTPITHLIIINSEYSSTDENNEKLVLKRLNMKTLDSKSTLSSYELRTENFVTDDIFDFKESSLDVLNHLSNEDSRSDKQTVKNVKNDVVVQDIQALNSVTANTLGYTLVLFNPNLHNDPSKKTGSTEESSGVELIKADYKYPSESNLKNTNPNDFTKKYPMNVVSISEIASSTTFSNHDLSNSMKDKLSQSESHSNLLHHTSSVSPKGHLHFIKLNSSEVDKTRSNHTFDSSRVWEELSLLDFSNREIIDDNELLSHFFENKVETLDKLMMHPIFSKAKIVFTISANDEQDSQLLKKVEKPDRNNLLEFRNIEFEVELTDNCDDLIENEHVLFILSLKYCDYRICQSKPQHERRFSGNIYSKSQDFISSNRIIYFGNYGSLDGIYTVNSKIKQKSITKSRESSLISRESFKALSHMLNLKSLMTRKSIQIPAEQLGVFAEHAINNEYADSESKCASIDSKMSEESKMISENSVDEQLISNYTKKTYDQTDKQDE